MMAGRLDLAQARQQCEAVHYRHVDVHQQQLDPGIRLEQAERLLAVAREREGEFAGTHLPTEALADQQLDIGLVVHHQDVRGGAHARVPDRARSRCFR